MAAHSLKEKRHLLEIGTALDKSSLPEQMRERVPPALEKVVEDFRLQPENRNGAGVTREAGKRTVVVLARMGHAIRHAEEHEDAEIRRQARRLLRTAQSETFERIEARAKEFVGLLRECGHRRNERLHREQAHRFGLDDGTELAEVPTLDSLRSVGRKLGNCVANRDWDARDYHHRLADGVSKFFTLSKEGEIPCLIEVNVDDNTIEEVSTEFAPTRKQALHILEALGATADKESAFADVGAFSPYLSGGTPDARRRVETNGRRYRIDAFTDQGLVVVRESSLKSGRVRSWSLFKRETPCGKGLAEWTDVRDGISLGEFASLLLQPKVAAVISRLFD